MKTAHEEEVYHRTRQYVEEHPASTNSNQPPQILIESPQQLYHQHHNTEDMNTSANIEISVSPTTAHSIDSGIKIETIELSEEEWHDIGIVKIPENNISSIVNERGTTPASICYSDCDTLMNVPNHTADKTLEPMQGNLNSSQEMSELSDSFDESYNGSWHETKDLKKHRHLNLNVFNILQSDYITKNIVSSKHKSLYRKERSLVVEAIVSFVIDKQIRLLACCFPFITEQILKIFPKEKFKTYFNQTIPSRTAGLLVTKYRRESLLLRKIGIKRYQERNRTAPAWLQSLPNISNNKK
ncbi:uncharacterized protein LOC119684211 [Teleopsis dalmanni]|nr:uncharacterized protein LOC119684211 [Teleopsis dalmanni]